MVTGTLVDSWHSYPSIYALGHRAVADLLAGPVNVEEKVDGCVTPDTPILMADLSYVPAGDLVVGDRLVGFSDTLNDPRLAESFVTAASPIKKRCYEIVTNGRRVVSSEDHPWLVGRSADHSASTNGRKRWVQTADLREGDEIVSLPSWDADKTWGAGWLAGFFDGEGSLVRFGNGRILSATQRTSPTLDLLLDLLVERGFKFSVDTRKRREDWSEVASVVIRGGWTEILRFLGSVRPPRLLAKAESIWVGAPTNGIPRQVVSSIRDVGEREVTGLSTSSATYVANGMLCHNSQFSFCVDESGEIRCRSKGATLNVDAPEKMFLAAVATVKSLAGLLTPGWTYRAEYLAKPKHNALAYDRMPKAHLILFDVNDGHESYLSYAAKHEEAERLGLECVPLIFSGRLTLADFRALLDRTSILGGQKIEGVVVKPSAYDKFGADKKVLLAKFVSEAFKEVHAASWKADNPTKHDVIERLRAVYNTPGRWSKAVQHLRERGLLEDSPRDIGKLIGEVQADVERECSDEIREKLFAWAWPQIQRGITSGLPAWYKEELVKMQFANEVAA